MGTNHRIPVTEQTRDELRELKEPGQTYDELLNEFIERKRREQIAADVKALFDRTDDPEKLKDAVENDDYDALLDAVGIDDAEMSALVDTWQDEAEDLSRG